MKVAAGAWWMVALSMAAALALAACGGDESTDEGSESETDEDTGGSARPDGGSEPDDEDAGTTPGEDATIDPEEDTTGGADTTPPADVSVPDTSTESPGDRALDPCGGANGDCVAGLDCLNTGSDGEGFCVLPCDGAACGFVRGEPAICALGVQGEPEPRYCVPLCDTDADCPPGITCQVINENLSVCAP